MKSRKRAKALAEPNPGSLVSHSSLTTRVVNKAARMSPAVINSRRRQLLTGLAIGGLLPFTRAGAKSAANKAAYDAVVVGAGVFGSWTAWQLARLGLSVALVDAYGPGNGLSSSGGETRVARMAYGPDAIYTQMAAESLRQWRALDQRYRQNQPTPLFFDTGVLWLSRQRNAYFDNSLETLARKRIAHRVFADARSLGAAYPQIALDGIHTGFLEPESGALAARQGVMAVVHEAQAAGVTLLQARAGQAEPLRRGGQSLWRVPLAAGPRSSLLARQVVYACGAWLPKVFPRLLQQRIVPTRQEVFYLDLQALSPQLAAAYAPSRLPVWADFNDGDVFYGIPDVLGYGFKIAHDKHGPVMDPDTADRHASAAAEAEMRAYLRRRFPAIAEAPLASVRVCQYENTANGDFLLDRHPQQDGVWLAGGGSGHGFKHGPAVGRYMAELLTGTRTEPHPRFSLQSKGRSQHRTVV
jgi:glycine/D-amino acid oxidase-like deaminating enzyme